MGQKERSQGITLETDSNVSESEPSTQYATAFFVSPAIARPDGAPLMTNQSVSWVIRGQSSSVHPSV